MPDRLIPDLRPRRHAAGLSQQQLADRAEITRQALLAIEAGRAVPSTLVSLRLARALGCKVEDLFRLPEPGTIEARWAGADAPGVGARVFLGRVADAWVAHPVPAGLVGGADGVIAGPGPTGRVRVEPLVELARVEAHVLVAGCAPVLGVLADRAAASTQAHLRWLGASSARALDLLEAGLVHVAGSHLLDEASGQHNLPQVRERFGERPMLVANLVQWRQGLVLPPGNPLGIRGLQDILRPEVRLAGREAGAGATKLLLRACAEADAPSEALPRGPQFAGHVEVAQAVALGIADVGVAIESVALAFGLHFVPLAEERFDLTVPAAWADHGALSRLLDALADAGFKREAAALGGYDTTHTADVVRVDAEGAR